jgi:hypothetical protein
MVGTRGIEPLTPSMSRKCSTAELSARRGSARPGAEAVRISATHGRGKRPVGTRPCPGNRAHLSIITDGPRAALVDLGLAGRSRPAPAALGLGPAADLFGYVVQPAPGGVKGIAYGDLKIFLRMADTGLVRKD